jgi:putative NIF3 family GTP cyclohydrolase 1 type 2
MLVMNKNEPNDYGRRKFITTVGKLAGTSMVLAVPSVSNAGKLWQIEAGFTVQQVIDLILKDVPNPRTENTVDKIRSGSGDQKVTGIVTTMFPSIEVIEKTKKAGANFIIAHETPFYNNPDEREWLKDDDAYKYKVDLLNKYGIAIWRFHDNWHGHRPDGITMGNLVKLGWEKYYDPQSPRLLTLPQPMTIKSIAELVKKRLGISTVRLVGNLKQECKTIYMAFGYMDPKMQIPVIQKSKPDLILSGETREWETVERVRDGLAMGQKTSLMVLGHSVSEEAGMQYLAQWLQPKVAGIKVTNIPSNNPFTFV